MLTLSVPSSFFTCRSLFCCQIKIITNFAAPPIFPYFDEKSKYKEFITDINNEFWFISHKWGSHTYDKTYDDLFFYLFCQCESANILLSFLGSCLPCGFRDIGRFYCPPPLPKAGDYRIRLSVIPHFISRL